MKDESLGLGFRIGFFFFSMRLFLKRRRGLRIWVRILALLLSSLIGGAVAGIAGILLGPIVVALYYTVTSWIVQKPGFVRDDEALFIGLIFGMIAGVWLYSRFESLSFSSTISMIIFGGVTGWVYTKLNVVYYQAC